MWRRFVATLAGAALVASCALVSGLDGYEIGDDASASSDGATSGDDASVDTATDSSPIDGGTTDANVPDGGDAGACPAVCNQGCDGTGRCIIRHAGSSRATVTCPPGRKCRVACDEFEACGNVDCSASTGCELSCTDFEACKNTTFLCGSVPCVLRCSAGEACDTMTIQAGASPGFCIECFGGGSACKDLVCTVPATCGKRCAGGGQPCDVIGNCNNCTTIAVVCPVP